jgi:hypothetical protein
MKIKVSVLLVSLLMLGGRAAFAQTDEYDRAGQFGVGVTTRLGLSAGPGIRYWFTNKWAIDGGASFYYDANSQNQSHDYTLNGSLVYVLKQKRGLRLEGLLTGGYSHTTMSFDDDAFNYHSVDTITEPFAGIGLGVEYSFQELPDLGFGAFVTGIGVRWTSESSVASDDSSLVESHTQKTSYYSSPDISLGVRYYF